LTEKSGRAHIAAAYRFRTGSEKEGFRTMQDNDQTISVPTAGKRYFGLGRNGSYEAAKAGTIPVIKVGQRLRVPIRLMEKLLDNADSNAATAAAK
jgi:hypothetical protein